jgi:hypothetical protein
MAANWKIQGSFPRPLLAAKSRMARTSVECPGDADRCKAVRSGARLLWDKNRHQPCRGELDSCAPVHRRQSVLPWQSWRFSGSRSTSAAKCRGALAPALQAAPSLLPLIESQIVRRQRVSAAAMAWNIVTPDFAAIDIGEVNNRRTITREQAPATNLEWSCPLGHMRSTLR